MTAVAPDDVSPVKVALVFREENLQHGYDLWGVYGRGTDNRVWWRPIDVYGCAPAGPWQAIAGQVGSGPDVLNAGSDAIWITARSTHGSVLVRRTTLHSGGPGWTDLGGAITSAPVFGGIDSDGTVGVFARGTDGSVWFRLLRGGVWQPWRSLGGQLTSAPDAVAGSDVPLTISGRGTDGAVWRRGITATGTPIGAWQRDSIFPSSAPSSVRLQEGDLGTFIRGRANNLVEVSSTSRSLGGVLTSAPDAAAPRLEANVVMTAVAVRGADNSMWLFDSSWHDLGGQLR